MQKLDGIPSAITLAKDPFLHQENIKDMKFDQGKLLAAIPFEDFPDAIKELIKVCTFGAQKYARSSWKDVPNGMQRYNDARARHFIDVKLGITSEKETDEESNIDHLAHEAWNCLALLQLKIEQRKRKGV